ncbi:MAG TPA: hypothetical protein DCS93_40800 [Microscillaceae bacterium]|nr:hypothetical protein [Microscillaceae bacterium]
MNQPSSISSFQEIKQHIIEVCKSGSVPQAPQQKLLPLDWPKQRKITFLSVFRAVSAHFHQAETPHKKKERVQPRFTEPLMLLPQLYQRVLITPQALAQDFEGMTSFEDFLDKLHKSIYSGYEHASELNAFVNE